MCFQNYRREKADYCRQHEPSDFKYQCLFILIELCDIFIMLNVRCIDHVPFILNERGIDVDLSNVCKLKVHLLQWLI